MLTFKQFLTESTIDFDMTDLSFKQKGREKLLKIGGLTFDEVKPYLKKATDSNVLSTYNKFVEKFPAFASALNKMKPDGVGPGEIIFYFVFDNVGVGGKNSPIDLYKDGKPWAEAKAGKVDSRDAIVNFKITKDGAPSVSAIMKDFEAFNSKYHEIMGEDLPDWRTAGELKVETLRKWTGIDLEDLAKKSTDGPKKAIDLILKKDGNLLRKGDEDPLINIKKEKSVKPLQSLIDGGKIEISKDDKAISTLEKILDRWVDGVFEDYLDGKKVALIDTKSAATRLAQFGEISKDQVGLYNTHRNQPWAEIYLSSTRKEQLKKIKSGPTKEKSKAEDIGRSLKK